MVVRILSLDEGCHPGSGEYRREKKTKKKQNNNQKESMDTGSETPLLMLHPTCIFYHDCIHPAQVENKEPDMERFFFFFFVFCFADGSFAFFFFFRDTTEDPMVLKANTSVSVCDTGLHFTEDTNRVFSPPNQAPRRQPSPNQLTSEPSATTWGGQESRSAV